MMLRPMLRLLLTLLPDRDREAVLGDLRDEYPGGPGSGAGVRRLWALAGIVVSYQPEPYRDAGRRRDAVRLLAVCLGLAWAVHAAAWRGLDPPPGYDPVSRLLLDFWGAPHLVSALTTGLLAGHVGGPASAHEGATVGRHVALAVALVLLWSAPSLVAGGMAAAVCMAAAVFGAAARRDAASP